MEIMEYQTLEQLEALKAEHLRLTVASCERLAYFLKNSLGECAIVHKEYAILCQRYVEFQFYNDLIDYFLDFLNGNSSRENHDNV